MPRLYKVYRVAVTTIKDYGAFVEMEGFDNKKGVCVCASRAWERL